MRRVVGLIAFCSIVLGADNVSYAEVTDESLSDKEINEIVAGLSSEDLQKLVQTAEKKGKLSVKSTKKSKKNTNKKAKKKKNKNTKNVQGSVLAENNATDDISNIDQNRKGKKKNKRKQKNILQNSENNVFVDNNMHSDAMNNFNQNQSVTRKKKKNKKKKNKQKNTLQNSELVTSSNRDRSISKKANNQSALFANKGNANKSYQLKKNKKENTADESWKYEVISATDLANRKELTVINEPVIDKSKIQKSSIVIEKDIKLASNSIKTKVKNKVTPPKLWSSTTKLASNDEINKTEKKIAPLKPLDKEKVLAHLDSKKDINLVANLNSSETAIKDKLQQIKNNREMYNLIKTPNKDLKDNIQVNKFRAELEHYRKIYASNLKKA